MKYVILVATLIAVSHLSAQAADGISGTWLTATGSLTQTFVFKVKQDSFTGLVCGPCDDPAAVFRIEDGKVLDAERVTFSIRYDDGVTRVTGTVSGNRLTVRNLHETRAENPLTVVLRRVVENGVSVAPKTRTLTAASGSIVASAFSRKEHAMDGKWVANGRLAQQNFVLKVRDGKVWGLVCGPCDPDGVFLIDDGTIEGDAVTFYINHIDTPPSARRTGLNRNIMRGTILGNVMKFTWVREGAENEAGGEMVLIGPIR